MTRFLSVTVLAAASFAISVSPASAIPILQLYVEGATYVAGGEDTWVYTGSGPVRLWAIGNVAGEGGKGSILDVKLAIAYDASQSPTFTLTPGTTGGLGGFTDPSTAAAAVYNQTGAPGTVPKLGDGSDLPSHGEYGAGVAWQEFKLGDFTLTDSPISDFITSFPAADGAPEGQISVYEIAAIDYSGTLHFDLYNHVQAGNKAKYKFAPFSHDGTGDCCTTVPEPGTVSLLASSLAALSGAFASRRRFA